MTAMKLKRINQKEPIIRLAIGFKQSTVQELEKYQAFYEQAYEEPVDPKQLVEQIVLEFVSSDKSFQKYKQEQKTKALQETKQKNEVQSLDAVDPTR